MPELNPTSLINTAKSIQRPVSLAAVSLLVMYLIFGKIVGKIENVDQTVLPAIINWIGIIALVTVALSVASYSLPYLLKGRAGKLVVGPPRIEQPESTTRVSHEPSEKLGS